MGVGRGGRSPAIERSGVMNERGLICPGFQVAESGSRCRGKRRKRGKEGWKRGMDDPAASLVRYAEGGGGGGKTRWREVTVRFTQ